MGTGGTITGVGRYLKQMNAKIEIVGVDPVGSIIYDYFYTGKMTEANSYKTEGIGEDFIPSNYDFDVIDDMVRVNDKESFLMARRLVREEGIFAGGSSGSAVAGALRYVAERELGPDKMIVVLLPDSGSRYLSKIFDDNWMRENRFLESNWVETPVAAVMERKSRRELVLARCDEPVEDVIAKMRDNAISQLPVIGEHDQLLGMVDEVSLLHHLLRQPGGEAAQTKIEDAGIIDTNVYTLNADTPVEAVMSAFGTNDIALITENIPDSDDKRVVGILTKIDMLDFLTTHSA
jgi:cystathionine beta-synthase